MLQKGKLFAGMSVMDSGILISLLYQTIRTKEVTFRTTNTILLNILQEKKNDFVLEVHHRLSEIYGSQIKYFHDLDPLSEFVSALLSHRTKNSNSAKAFNNLMLRG